MVQRFDLGINLAVTYLFYFLYIQDTLYQSYHTDQAQIFYIDCQMLVSQNLQQNKFTPKFKDLYSSPIEIINRLTDMGQFQYLPRLKGPKREFTGI